MKDALLDQLKIKSANSSQCVAQNQFGAEAAFWFAIATFVLLLLPTMWLSVIFLLDTRKMLKRAGKFNLGMKILFGVGLVTCTGYIIKEMMKIIIRPLSLL